MPGRLGAPFHSRPDRPLQSRPGLAGNAALRACAPQVPKLPGRYYFLFGSPIDASGVDANDKEACAALYRQVPGDRLLPASRPCACQATICLPLPCSRRRGAAAIDLEMPVRCRRCSWQVQAEVEASLAYLLARRKDDPYEAFLPRAAVEASWNFTKAAPSFAIA